MLANQRAVLLASSIEQRTFQRNGVNLPGILIVPAEDVALPCQVTNLSGGGACVTCDNPPPLHSYVILCLEGFDRLEGIIRRAGGAELGLQFVFKPAKRRLLSQSDHPGKHGGAEKAGLRRHARLPSISKIRFTLDGGEELSCEVIDVSAQGLSLRTEARPPVHAVISIGRKYGRVVRHHGEGIAVEFAGATP